MSQQDKTSRGRKNNNNSVYSHPLPPSAPSATLMMAEESGRENMDAIYRRAPLFPGASDATNSEQMSMNMMARASGRTDFPASRMMSDSSGRRFPSSLYTQTLMMASGSGRATDDCAHPRVQCDGCRQMIGNGIRYKCLDCKDFDLCEQCEATTSTRHFYGTHLFCKVRDSRAIDVNAYVRK